MNTDAPEEFGSIRVHWVHSWVKFGSVSETQLLEDAGGGLDW